MTSKLTITDERVISVIENLEHYASNLKWTDVRGAQDLLAAADGLRELQERRKAAMDSEHKRNPVLAYADSYRDMAKQGVESVPIWSVITDLERNIAPLYRHAQPAPVVTFYRDGIEAAASYLDQQREAYDSEHGWSDPDTGSFEFGSEIKREYSSTLEELAEGIRALHPNAGNSPVIPEGYVMVPKEPTMEMLDEFDSIIDYGAEDSQDAWRRLLAAAPQEVKP